MGHSHIIARFSGAIGLNSISNAIYVRWGPPSPLRGFPGGTSSQESTGQSRRHKRGTFNPWVRKIPWRRNGNPLQYSLPEKFHGQRNLVGYSVWGPKESDMYGHAHTHAHTHTHTHTHTHMHTHTLLLSQILQECPNCWRSWVGSGERLFLFSC